MVFTTASTVPIPMYSRSVGRHAAEEEKARSAAAIAKHKRVHTYVRSTNQIAAFE